MLLASTGGRFDVALPDADARRFLSDIKNNSSAFFDMLALVKTERSECSRLEDRDRIFDAVRSIEGGFCSVDRMVFRAMESWFVRRLEMQVVSSQEQGLAADAAEWQRVLGMLLCYRSEFEQALPKAEVHRNIYLRKFGPDHPDTISAVNMTWTGTTKRCSCTGSVYRKRANSMGTILYRTSITWRQRIKTKSCSIAPCLYMWQF